MMNETISIEYIQAERNQCSSRRIRANQCYGFGKTSVDKVFSAGDSARGASLIVWAIAHARAVAEMVDGYLKG